MKKETKNEIVIKRLVIYRSPLLRYHMLAFLIIQHCNLMSATELGPLYASTCPAFLAGSIHGGHQITESSVMLVPDLFVSFLDLK